MADPAGSQEVRRMIEKLVDLYASLKKAEQLYAMYVAAETGPE